MKKSIIIILSALLLLFTACQDGTSPSSGTAAVPSGSEPTGTLLVQDIEAGTTAITLSGSMDNGYSIFLKAVPTDGSDAVVSDIPAGDWIFYLNFTDVDGNVIGYGTRIVTVPEDGTAEVSCNFGTPAAAPGDVDFTLVLDGWFDAIFDAYGIPGENDYDTTGIMIRNGTSGLFNLLFGQDVPPIEDISICDIVNLNSFIPSGEDTEEKCNEENPSYDLPYLDQEGWIALYNEIFFTFQLNMLYYYNMLVFDILPPNLTGIEEGDIFESSQTGTMTADVEIGAECADAVDVDILWYLNGFYIGESDDEVAFDVDMSGGVEGENTITAAVTYQGVALGMESVEFTVETSGETRWEIAQLAGEFGSADLYAKVADTELTYADEVTGTEPSLSMIYDITNDLTGLEYLENLETLILAYNGITTVEQINPLLGLANLKSLTLWENPVVGQDIRSALATALLDCSFDFGDPVQ